MIIQFVAPFLDHSGYGEASRNTLLAMHKAGIKITTKIVSFTEDELDVGIAADLARKLEKKYCSYDVNLIELTPEHFPFFIEKGKYNIGYFFWEVEGVDKEWVRWCNMMDEIWLPTPMFVKTFRSAGVVKPVKAIPCCMDMNFKAFKPFNLSFAVRPKVIFYSIFQWTERKNPQALIKTYWKQFQGIDNVALIVKTYRSNFADSEKQKIRDIILKWKRSLKIKHYPKLYLLLNDMNHEDIMRFHATGDVFVSTHRGEGWGYSQMNAMAFGNLVISTNFGGIHEYLSPQKAMLVEYKLKNVFGMKHILWYHHNQKWADIDTDNFGNFLKRAYMMGPDVKKIADTGSEFVAKKFNYMQVGRRIQRLLSEISLKKINS